jgi:undecaprenyl-diphosphatase
MIDLDQRVERWIAEHRVEWLDPLVVAITYAGTFGALWIALGVVVAVALRRPVIALAIPATVLLADLAASGLKHAVDRDRPAHAVDALVSTPSSPAFPSGHAATSFAAAVLLAAAVPQFAPGIFVLASLVAWSRLYVGVHYPLDIVVGAVLGALVATVLLLLARALRRSRPQPTRGRPTTR